MQGNLVQYHDIWKYLLYVLFVIYFLLEQILLIKPITISIRSEAVIRREDSKPGPLCIRRDSKLFRKKTLTEALVSNFSLLKNRNATLFLNSKRRTN